MNIEHTRDTACIHRRQTLHPSHSHSVAGRIQPVSPRAGFFLGLLNASFLVQTDFLFWHIQSQDKIKALTSRLAGVAVAADKAPLVSHLTSKWSAHPSHSQL